MASTPISKLIGPDGVGIVAARQPAPGKVAFELTDGTVTTPISLPPGEPGPNNVPTDEFMASKALDPNSLFGQAQSAKIGAGVATGLAGADIPGRVAEAVADAPAVAAAAAAAATAAVEAAIEGVNVQAGAGFGDSMLGDQGSLGVTVPGVLSNILGVPFFAGGVGGHTSTEVGVRQGGVDVFITVAGNTIPASGSVALTVTSPGAWRAEQGFTCLGKLAGVAGTLRRVTEGTWTFARTAPGDPVSVIPESRFESAYAAYRDRVTLIRTGRNNTTSGVDVILRDDKAMVAGLAGTNNRFLVISLYNSSAEPSGSAGYNTVKAINDARAAAFGPNYYDLRGWIIRNGLAQAGITPTTQDLTDIANDVVPSSLRMDSTHMNAIGRQVEAQQLARLIVSKGWIVPVVAPPTILTVTNHADNPRVGVDTTSWSVAGGGGTGTGARVATGGPLDECPSFYRATWSVAPTSSPQVLVNGSGKNLIEAGKTYTARCFARASWSGATAQIIAGRTDGASVIGTAPNGGVATLSPNTWAALPSVTFTAETGTIRARLAVQLGPTSTKPTTSDTFDVSGWFLYDADDRLVGVSYRDGGSAGWAWAGAAHGSPSTGPVTV